MRRRRPRLLTVVRDQPDRHEVEQLLLGDGECGRCPDLELKLVEAARVHPASGPSNVLPFRPRRARR